jgi:hypothetical protein
MHASIVSSYTANLYRFTVVFTSTARLHYSVKQRYDIERKILIHGNVNSYSELQIFQLILTGKPIKRFPCTGKLHLKGVRGNWVAFTKEKNFPWTEM